MYVQERHLISLPLLLAIISLVDMNEIELSLKIKHQELLIFSSTDKHRQIKGEAMNVIGFLLLTLFIWLFC